MPNFNFVLGHDVWETKSLAVIRELITGKPAPLASVRPWDYARPALPELRRLTLEQSPSLAMSSLTSTVVVPVAT
jgi:hypothetical protein